MKKKLQFIIALLTVTTMSAQFTVGDITYTPTATEVEVTDFPDTGAASTDVVIPETVMDGGTTYTVTSIGANAFQNSNITTLVMANTITSVGNNAVRTCTSLTEVTLSTALTTLSNDMFRGNTLLATVNNMGNITTTGNRSFRDCPAITSLDLSGITDLTQNGTTRMPGILSENLPNVVNIGDFNFFNNTSLTDVNIGSTLITINSGAFDMPETVTVTVNTDTPIEPTGGPFAFVNSGSDPMNIDVIVPSPTAFTNYTNAASAWSVFNIIDATTLSNETPLANEFSVSPNPTSGIINITNSNTLTASVSIFNIMGAKVLNKDIVNSDQVDISDLAAGVYILRIDTADGRELTKRIVKN